MGGGKPLVLYESGGAQYKNLKKWGGALRPPPRPLSSAYVYIVCAVFSNFVWGVGGGGGHWALGGRFLAPPFPLYQSLLM